MAILRGAEGHVNVYGMVLVDSNVAQQQVQRMLAVLSCMIAGN
ncbi:MAG TPA: hypothetical protein VGT04_00305 [Acidobacteriaceae bacterium]|nr:hypothetical protein [Acidobacteriaceae bacterium]